MATSSDRIATVFALFLLPAAASAQVTQRVSLGSANEEAAWPCDAQSVSADGRFVSFSSFTDYLVPGDTNQSYDVFVRDRLNGTLERVSVNSSGVEGNDDSYGGWLSADGRFVVFWSYASNLVPGDTNGASDCFVRDRLTGTTEIVSVSTGGALGNSYSFGGPITPDGRYVAFDSLATNLVPGGTPQQAYVRDRLNGTTEIVSVQSGGAAAGQGSGGPTMSADGRYVAFISFATDLVPGDTNGCMDVFVHDRQTNLTTRVSVDSNGVQADATRPF